MRFADQRLTLVKGLPIPKDLVATPRTVSPYKPGGTSVPKEEFKEVIGLLPQPTHNRASRRRTWPNNRKERRLRATQPEHWFPKMLRQRKIDAQMEAHLKEAEAAFAEKRMTEEEFAEVMAKR